MPRLSPLWWLIVRIRWCQGCPPNRTDPLVFFAFVYPKLCRTFLAPYESPLCLPFSAFHADTTNEMLYILRSLAFLPLRVMLYTEALAGHDRFCPAINTQTLLPCLAFPLCHLCPACLTAGIPIFGSIRAPYTALRQFIVQFASSVGQLCLKRLTFEQASDFAFLHTPPPGWAHGARDATEDQFACGDAQPARHATP